MANIPIRMTTRAVEPSVNGTVVVRDKIPELRAAISTLANELGNHIGSVGNDAHVIGDLTQPGFMSPELYDFLIGFQDKIDALQQAVDLAALPNNSMLYWAGSDDSVPEGFKVCNGSDNAPDARDRFILGASSDSDVGETGGQQNLDLSNLPIPRHTHTFNNYCQCEVYSELQYNVGRSPGASIRNTGGGWCGSNSDSHGSTYPLYYTDTTNSSGSSISGSDANVNLEPSYYTLKTIMKSTEKPQYAADGVGTVHISFGATIPEGCLELNGQQVDASAYSALYNYARLNSLIIDSAKYTSILNEYGSAPYFAFNEETNLLKIPTIKSVIAGSALYDTKYNAPTVQSEHYHGLGKMRNNNGYWGRRSYSGATYPSGTTAWFWNGRGGLGGGTSSMETSGDVIVSYPIHVGATGNGEACDSLNVVCSIRAYHPGAVDLSTTMTLAEDDPKTLSLTAATAMSVLTEDETVVADYGSVADEAGWLRETNGLQEVWGHAEAGDSATLTISYPLSFNNEIFYIDVHNQNGSKSNVTVVDFSLTSATLNLGANFEPTDIIEYRILGY
mgnify:CR=1 FL=1|jgi:hypothetical protein